MSDGNVPQVSAKMPAASGKSVQAALADMEAMQVPLFDLHGACMEQLRYLAADQWKGVSFFLGMNTAVMGIVTAALTIALQNPAVPALALPPVFAHVSVCAAGATFCLVGLLVTRGIALPMLTNHRIYYLECQVQKILLEHHLGLSAMFEQGKLRWDFSLIWRMGEAPRERLLSGTVNVSEWMRDIMWWRGSVAWRLKTCYRVISLLYCIGLLVFIGLSLVRGLA